MQEPMREGQKLGLLPMQVLPMNTGVEGGETAIKLARCASRILCLGSASTCMQ